MTTKEFKAILEMAGISFEVFGWEGILNELSQNNRRMANDLEKSHLNAASCKCREIADVIFEELESRGYYKDVM